MAPNAEHVKALNSLVDTALTLLQQLQSALGDIRRNPTAPSPPEHSSIDVLALARDSSTLIRAHSTKLSLLLINEPFTPSAVSTVIRELVKGPIPGLASSVQICDTTRYTAVLRRELAYRAQRVLAELEVLLKKVPKDGKVLSGGNKNGGKGSLTTTGVLWSACDDVTKLANMGVGGFFVKKVEEWRDTLKDVMEELKEWGEEEADDDEDDEDDDDDDDEDDEADDLADQLKDSHISTQQMLDDWMDSEKSIPRSDPDKIRPRLDSTLKRLRLVALLYQAIAKRRLKKLPPVPPTDTTSKLPQQLDDLAKTLQELPDKFGDLATTFYELKPKEIDEAMEECFGEAFTVSEVLSKGWDGSKDEFTEWAEKFQVEIKKSE